MIRRFGLYSDQRRAGATQDSLLAQFRGSVSIFPAGMGSNGPQGSFRIAFQDRDAETAARVANHLAWRFIEETVSAWRATYMAAAQFLSAHVASAKRGLDLRDAALREFQLRHSAELPEQAESLRGHARRLRAELAAMRDEVQALERDKKRLERPGQTFLSKPPTTAPPPPAAPEGGSSNVAAARRSQADTLETRLTALLALYKPDHPDVRRLQAELAQAQSLDFETVDRPQPDPKPNGVHAGDPKPSPGNDTDRARLGQIQARLEALATRRIQAAAELGVTEQRLQRLPLRQHELATLTREQAFFSEQFRSLAARLQSAQMAEAFERSYPSERVVLLDQARPPSKPVSPNRLALLAVASLGGLLLGCLLAIARNLQTPARCALQPLAPTIRERNRRSYITA